MSILRLGILFLALIGTATHARAGWADSLFDESSFDFGSVPRGPVLTHPFRVVNKTGTTVHISYVRVSCGCTSAHAVQTMLAPGQETTIVAQMDSRRFFGHKAVTIYVQFDQPEFDEVRLVVQGDSRSDLAILPETLALGRIRKGTSPSASVTVSFLGDSQSQIVKARCDSNYVRLDLKEVRRDSGEVSYQVTAHIRPDAPAGKWYTDVWLTTEYSSMQRIRVPLTVQIEAPPPVPVIPMGLVKAGSQAERKVILRGSQPFRVVGFSGTDHEVRVRDNKAESRNIHVLTINVRPEEPGILNRTIRIKTDMPNGSDIEFNARAHVVP